MQELLRIWPIGELNVQNKNDPYSVTLGLIHSDEFAWNFFSLHSLLIM